MVVEVVEQVEKSDRSFMVPVIGKVTGVSWWCSWMAQACRDRKTLKVEILVS